jgi:hypothetical protein
MGLLLPTDRHAATHEQNQILVGVYACLLDEILQPEILANEAKVNMFKRWAQVKNDVE